MRLSARHRRAARPRRIAGDSCCGRGSRARAKPNRPGVFSRPALAAMDTLTPDGRRPTATLAVGPPAARGERGVHRIYHLLRVIGEGHGTLPAERRWSARPAQLIKPGPTRGPLASSRNDARPGAMEHPNIARLFDGGVTEGRPYFMDWWTATSPGTATTNDHAAGLSTSVRVCQAVRHAITKA